jgi:hypothetical protein
MADHVLIAAIVEAMHRELSPELVARLSDLPITEIPRPLETEPECIIVPYDPARPDRPQGTHLDCATMDTPNGQATGSSTAPSTGGGR